MANCFSPPGSNTGYQQSFGLWILNALQSHLAQLKMLETLLTAQDPFWLYLFPEQNWKEISKWKKITVKLYMSIIY